MGRSTAQELANVSGIPAGQLAVLDDGLLSSRFSQAMARDRSGQSTWGIVQYGGSAALTIGICALIAENLPELFDIPFVPFLVPLALGFVLYKMFHEVQRRYKPSHSGEPMSYASARWLHARLTDDVIAANRATMEESLA
jgi:hypothetical protein